MEVVELPQQTVLRVLQIPEMEEMVALMLTELAV